ncbi:MAG: dienelactone hydrolase family protein [Endomicrobiaceae bacterium]|nr:dienelactone hydrolase family protein [Endomicrobiaceae bacterium]
MKILKILFLISVLFICTKYSYAYEKLDFFDQFHIYTPYIYILQNDTTIEEVNILVLFHDYEKGKKDKKTIFGFAEESANWEAEAEKEKFFIMGFDLYDYKDFFNKENMDKVNKRILMEIDRMRNTCGTKKVNIYVAGTKFGANAALLFNLLYNNYEAALCMNMSKPDKNIEKYFDKAEGKNFYFFHAEKNKSNSVSKINGLKKKLIKKGATAEVYTYKDVEKNLPNKAYIDAIDKISEK